MYINLFNFKIKYYKIFKINIKSNNLKKVGVMEVKAIFNRISNNIRLFPFAHGLYNCRAC